MSKAHLEFVIRTLCLALGLFAWGGSAYGTIYRGGLDPVLFHGFADINVGDNCIGVDISSTGDCTANQVTFLDASVHVTDTNPGATADFTVTWATHENVITGLDWSDGHLIGIASDQIFDSTPSGYVLQFLLDPTATITCQNSVESDVSWVEDGHTLCGDLASASATQTGFDPVSVPEPASLILLLGAVGAAWLSRRKLHVI